MIIVMRTYFLTVPNTETAAPGNINKKLVFKSCAALCDCISGIHNTEVDHAKDIAVIVIVSV